MQTSSLPFCSHLAEVCRYPAQPRCHHGRNQFLGPKSRCRDAQPRHCGYLYSAALRAAKQEPAANLTSLVTDKVPQNTSSDWEPVEVAAANGVRSVATSTSSGQVQPALPVDIRPADNRWYTVVGLSALAALICSVDRAAISVAILPMSEQFHWSDSTKGAINSAFYVGYTLTNLLGGYLASSLSAKKVLGAGVVVWSLFTMTTPVAAGAAMPVLLTNRAFMGAGEGVTFPSVQNLVKGWVPPDARSRALTLIYSGGQLGTIIALITAPLIIKAFGWPAVFEVYGALGLLWTLAWQPLVADHPPLLPQWKQISAGPAPGAAAAAAQIAAPKQELLPDFEVEVAHDDGSGGGLSGSNGNGVSERISSGSMASTSGSEGLVAAAADRGKAGASSSSMPQLWDVPWKSFFTNKPFIALIMAHGSFGVGHYVSLSWLPTYYNQEFGVDVQQSALLSVLPWFVTVIMSSSSGWIADYLANSGTLTMTQTRKLMQLVGSVGPAMCLLYLASTHDHPGELDMGKALVLLTGTLAIGGFQSAGFASNHQDISSKYAAVLFGITNALSSLMGTCSVYATGVILDATSSWALVFNLVAGFYLLGAVFYVSWASAEQQFE